MIGFLAALAATVVAGAGAGVLPLPPEGVDAYTVRWVVPVSVQRDVTGYDLPLTVCSSDAGRSACLVQRRDTLTYRIPDRFGASGEMIAATLGVPVAGSVDVGIGCGGTSTDATGVTVRTYPDVTRYSFRVITERGDSVRTRRPDGIALPPYRRIGYDRASPVVSVAIPDGVGGCVVG